MDVDIWIDRLMRGELLGELELVILCRLVQQILGKEPNVVEVHSPVVVCGDIHGQMNDLLQIFRQAGALPYTNYVFMGDYVDRGDKSVEVISLLLALKIRYPERITLLRGNHECRDVTRRYGFYDECRLKYGTPEVWTTFMQTFDYLPVSALIDGKIFCLHGGLSPQIIFLDQARALDRFQEIPISGPMTDLVWSDPEYNSGWASSKRGAGFYFGADITTEFNHLNHLNFIARAHQVAPDGYMWQHDHGIVTIFSAANYCKNQYNLGSIMELDETLNYDFLCYESTPIPTCRAQYYTGDDSTRLRSCDEI